MSANSANSNRLFGQLANIIPAATKILNGNAAVGLGTRLFNNSFITGSSFGSTAFDMDLSAIDNRLDGTLNFGENGQVSPNLDLLNSSPPTDTSILKEQQELVIQLNSAGLSIETSDDLATLNQNINNAISQNPNTIINALNAIQSDQVPTVGVPSINELLNSGPVGSGSLDKLSALNLPTLEQPSFNTLINSGPVGSGALDKLPALPTPALPTVLDLINSGPLGSALNLFGPLGTGVQETTPAKPTPVPTKPAEISEIDKEVIASLHELVGEDTGKLNLIRQSFLFGSLGGFDTLAQTGSSTNMFSANVFNPFSMINRFIYADALKVIDRNEDEAKKETQEAA